MLCKGIYPILEFKKFPTKEESNLWDSSCENIKMHVSLSILCQYLFGITFFCSPFSFCHLSSSHGQVRPCRSCHHSTLAAFCVLQEPSFMDFNPATGLVKGPMHSTRWGITTLQGELGEQIGSVSTSTRGGAAPGPRRRTRFCCQPAGSRADVCRV